jgi:8-oxo-dGTP diphosphatase
MGWERFREIVAGASIPVYALGGMRARDLEQARRCGAHGLAMVRGAWEI